MAVASGSLTFGCPSDVSLYRSSLVSGRNCSARQETCRPSTSIGPVPQRDVRLRMHAQRQSAVYQSSSQPRSLVAALHVILHAYTFPMDGL